MDECDQAFYELTVSQRNLAWYQLEKAESRIAALEGHLAKYREATRTVLEREGYEWYWQETWNYGGYEWHSVDIENVLEEIEKELNR